MTNPYLKEITHPRYAYRVVWQEGEKREQRYFRKDQRADAEQLVRQKETEQSVWGTRNGVISAEERAAIITFREAVRDVTDPPSLSECVAFYISSNKSTLAPITVEELIKRRVIAAERKGVHQRTMRDLVGVDGTKGRLGMFADAFGARQVSSITGVEIELWADEACKTEATKREVLVRVRGLFAFAVKRKLLRDNPVDDVQIPRQNPARAAILAVHEVESLLKHTPPAIIPAVAVQLFAGLRYAEAERLRWESVDLEHKVIKVTQRKGAGNRREKSRFVPILPPLEAIFAPCNREGFIFPIGRKQTVSGQIYRTGFLAARHGAGIKEWDENTLRHCYGSYRVAMIQDLERVKMEMGHTTSRTTSEHYLNAVRERDAAMFWAIKLSPDASSPPEPAQTLPGHE